MVPQPERRVAVYSVKNYLERDLAPGKGVLLEGEEP